MLVAKRELDSGLPLLLRFGELDAVSLAATRSGDIGDQINNTLQMGYYY